MFCRYNANCLQGNTFEHRTITSLELPFIESSIALFWRNGFEIVVYYFEITDCEDKGIDVFQS